MNNDNIGKLHASLAKGRGKTLSNWHNASARILFMSLSLLQLLALNYLETQITHCEPTTVPIVRLQGC